MLLMRNISNVVLEDAGMAATQTQARSIKGLVSILAKLRTLANGEAPEGFQDHAGFHLGDWRSPRSRISSQTDPCGYSVSQQDNVTHPIFRPPLPEAAI
jgi:hypothetical protein